jgi:hypothetical protein
VGGTWVDGKCVGGTLLDGIWEAGACKWEEGGCTWVDGTGAAGVRTSWDCTGVVGARMWLYGTGRSLLGRHEVSLAVVAFWCFG